VFFVYHYEIVPAMEKNLPLPCMVAMTRKNQHVVTDELVEFEK
jgi:hypothetical protein